jgi:Uma2 family endonuclease
MKSGTVPGHPDIELVYDDAQPMDSPWHREQMQLLIELTHTLWKGRTDYYTGGNMFIYFSAQQARNRDYRGPDYFAVTGVDGLEDRKAWIVWEEGGRYPDIIVELLSPSTRNEDLGFKKDLYERTFRTPEYFCVDPDSGTLRGWRLLADRYEPLLPGEGGRLESRVLGASIGLVDAVYHGIMGRWARLWTPAGVLVPRQEEIAAAACAQAAAERERADAERARADAAARRAAVMRDAGRIVGAYHRRGVDAAREEMRRADAGRAELLDAIAAIDPEVAAALREG